MRGKGGSSTGQREKSNYDVDLTKPRPPCWGAQEPPSALACWDEMAGPYTTDCVLLRKDADPSEMGSAAEADSEGADSKRHLAALPGFGRCTSVCHGEYPVVEGCLGKANSPSLLGSQEVSATGWLFLGL